MEKDLLLSYESPSIEVIEVEVENGFVASTQVEGWGGFEEW